MSFRWTIANAVAMRNNKEMTKNEKYVKNHITGFNYRFQEPLPLPETLCFYHRMQCETIITTMQT